MLKFERVYIFFYRSWFLNLLEVEDEGLNDKSCKDLSFKSIPKIKGNQRLINNMNQMVTWSL